MESSLQRKLWVFVVSLFLTCALCRPASFSKAMGYTTVECKDGSDTVVSVPLFNKSAFRGLVAGAPVEPGTGGDDTADVTVSSEVTLEGDKTYHLIFNTGNHRGKIFKVTQVSGEVVTLDLKGDTLLADGNELGDGDSCTITPFWTLGSLFPDDNRTIIESTGFFGFQRQTRVLLPDMTGEGINLAPTKTFYQASDGNWRDTADGPADPPAVNDTLLWPDTYFIVRHPVGKGPTDFIPMGAVSEEDFTVVLHTRKAPAGSQDNFVAIPRPVPIALDDLGLGGSTAFVSSTGDFGFQRGDQLLVFDNTQANQQNKAPLKTYFYNGAAGQWRDGSNRGVDAGAVELNPAEGFIIRKKETVDGASVFWVNPARWGAED